MEKDLATGREPDETVALSDQQLHETARGSGAAPLRAAQRRLLAGGPRRPRHSPTSAVLADGGRPRNRRRRRRCALP